MSANDSPHETDEEPTVVEDEAEPEDAIASLDDFKISRDAEGEILPVKEPLPGTDKYVRVRPLAQGDAEEYLPDHGDPRQLRDDKILELLHEFYVAPDFSSVESLDEIAAYGLDPLLMALMNASGFDYAQSMVASNSELMEAVEGNTKRGN